VVNGNPIKKHFLQNNDVIELGKYKLKFIGRGERRLGGRRQGDFEKTMVLRPQSAARQTGGEALRSAPGRAARGRRCRRPPRQRRESRTPPRPSPPAPPPAAPRPAGQPVGAIQLLSGANAGKELELTKPLTTLGKPGVQVAVLTRRPQGYFITHVEGAARPNVNGQQIGPAPHALKDHDVIELAGVKMEFFLKA
jgi:hypothetical protein